MTLYSDDTAIIATSRTPVLLVSYLQTYLSHLERWLTEWRIAINVSKSSAIIFARAGRRFIQPRSVTLFGGQSFGSIPFVIWGDPGQMTYLIASHRTGEQENCSKDGFAGSSPEQEE